MFVATSVPALSSFVCKLFSVKRLLAVLIQILKFCLKMFEKKNHFIESRRVINEKKTDDKPTFDRIIVDV